MLGWLHGSGSLWADGWLYCLPSFVNDGCLGACRGLAHCVAVALGYPTTARGLVGVAAGCWVAVGNGWLFCLPWFVYV